MFRARVLTVAALLLILPAPQDAVAQGRIGARGGVLVVPHGRGDTGSQLGISVTMTGDRTHSTDLDLVYFVSQSSQEYYPPCPFPGCTGTVVERSRIQLVGGGPTFTARIRNSRLKARLGGVLVRQRYNDENSWQAGLSAGIGVEVWERSAGSVALDARMHRMFTGGAFAPWLLPIGIEVRF
jgi:hypothetical protein